MTTCGDITAPMNKLKQIDVYGVPLRCWCSEFCKKLGGQIGEMVDRVVMVKDGTRSFPVRLKENSELVTIDWFSPDDGCQNEGDKFVENVRISGTKDKKEPSNNRKALETGNGRYDKNHLFRKYEDRDRDREKEVDGRKALDKGKAGWIRKTKKKPLLYPSCKNCEDGYWVVFETKYLMEADENTEDGESEQEQNRKEAHDEQGLSICMELNTNKERLKSVIMAKESGMERRSGGDNHASRTDKQSPNLQPKSHSMKTRRSSTRVSEKEGAGKINRGKKVIWNLEEEIAKVIGNGVALGIKVENGD
ncbi:hypothetical protein Q3G72_006460 [Acer saccharum]|nr:hypothetical protein Q3G72_006460 [Acer saccharum]